MRVRDWRERFERGWIDAEIHRSRRVVRGGVLRDHVLGSVLSRHGEAARKTGLPQELRLFGIVRNTEMRAFRPDVSGFDEPIRSEFALHRQVPLLRGRRDPV